MNEEQGRQKQKTYDKLGLRRPRADLGFGDWLTVQTAFLVDKTFTEA